MMSALRSGSFAALTMTDEPLRAWGQWEMMQATPVCLRHCSVPCVRVRVRACLWVRVRVLCVLWCRACLWVRALVY